MHTRSLTVTAAAVLLGGLALAVLSSGCQETQVKPAQQGPASADGAARAVAAPRAQPLAAGAELLADDFDRFDVRTPAPWTVDFPDGVLTPFEAPRGRIVVLEGLGEQWVRLSRSVDPARVAGRVLVVRVQTRFTPPGGLAAGQRTGGTIQLDVGGPRPLVCDIPPSSGWVTTEALFAVPADATRCDLSIGLDKALGTLAINNLAVEDLDPAAACGWQAAGAGKSDEPRNLVINGDFETGLKGWSVGAWRSEGAVRVPARCTWTLDGEAPLGARCLKVTAHDGVAGVVSQWFRRGPATAEHVSFYGKATADVALQVCVVGADGSRVGQRVTLGKQWKRYEVKLPPIAGGTSGLYHVELSSSGAWPADASAWFDGVMLATRNVNWVGADDPSAYVDAEAIPIGLALGRERAGGVANLFAPHEPVVATVTVLNRLGLEATLPLRVEVCDAFGRVVLKEEREVAAPPRGLHRVAIPLKLAPGWYRVTATVTPPAGLFGNEPACRDERIVAVVAPPLQTAESASSGAGAFGLQLSTAGASPELPALGIGWLRVAPRWSAIETAARTYAFGAYEPAVQSARRAKLDVVAVLGPRLDAASVPAFHAQPAAGAGTQPVAPVAASRFSDFTAKLVRALGPRGVTAYQVLDGANCDLSAQDYLTFFKLAAVQVQAHQPDAQAVVDAGRLGGPGDPVAFLRECLAVEPSLAEQPVAFTTASSADADPEALIGVLAAAQQVKASFGIPELWDTCFGAVGPSGYLHVFPVSGAAAGTGDGRCPQTLAPATEAGWVARGVLVRASFGLQRWAWAATAEPASTIAEPVNGVSLTEYDGSLRPAAVAYAWLAERLRGARPRGLRTLNGPAAGYAATFERPDKSVLVALWRPEPGAMGALSLDTPAGVQVTDAFGTPLADRGGTAGIALELNAIPVYLQADAAHAAALLAAIEKVSTPLGGALSGRGRRRSAACVVLPPRPPRVGGPVLP